MTPPPQLLTCGTDRKITYWEVDNMSAIRETEGSATAEVWKKKDTKPRSPARPNANPDGRFFVSLPQPP